MTLIKIQNFVRSINTKIAYVSMAALFLLMCMTSINTVLNTASLGSIPDAFPITEFLMILIIFCALAFQESDKEHIRVDMFVVMLPKVIGKIVNIVFDLLTVAAIGYLSYAYFADVGPTRASLAASSLLKIPEWPFRAVVGIAVAMFAITVFINMFEHFMPEKPKEDEESKETPEETTEEDPA